MTPPAKAFRTYAIAEHLIQSNAVADTYRIQVARPMARSDGSERFPVVYATDSDHFFGGLSNLAALLQGYSETPRFILVGIGYENAGAAAVLRMRDLFPRSVQTLLRTYIERVAHSEFVTGLRDVRQITATTDSSDFLHFIRAELMPYIAARYPIAPADNTFWGYSAGGTFGLFTLVAAPETFQRYVLGSPGVSYKGQSFGIEMAKQIRPSSARLFLSVGELEDSHPAAANFDLVTGYIQLVEFLKQTPPPGLDLTTRIFPGETHATGWTAAFSHGLKAVFGPAAAVPFWPDTLK